MKGCRPVADRRLSVVYFAQRMLARDASVRQGPMNCRSRPGSGFPEADTHSADAAWPELGR